MVIREIKNNPELIKTFDWFNDYKDTVKWAKHNCPEIVNKLKKGFNEYKKQKGLKCNLKSNGLS